MIISMSDILCVTNRKLCRDSFLHQVEKLAKANPAGIILREKDLPEEEYMILAQKVLDICKKNGTLCILHNFVKVALKLNAKAIHLPLDILKTMSETEKKEFKIIGASCHSIEDAKIAQQLGCIYITAGHIFETDCKKDIPGRGLDFLNKVSMCVSIPVYAIGGINEKNISDVRKSGANGACIMSGAMKCVDPVSYLKTFKKVAENEI